MRSVFHSDTGRRLTAAIEDLGHTDAKRLSMSLAGLPHDPLLTHCDSAARECPSGACSAERLR